MALPQDVGTIDEITEFPSLSNKTNFDSLVDSFIETMVAFVPQFNTRAGEINTIKEYINTSLADLSTKYNAIAVDNTNGNTGIYGDILALYQAILQTKEAVDFTYDAFDDRRLGNFAEHPLTDNDGDPLQMGASYYNTVEHVSYVYDSILDAWKQDTFIPTDSSSVSFDNTGTDIVATVLKGVIIELNNKINNIFGKDANGYVTSQIFNPSGDEFDGVAYSDPDVLGANPVSLIYPDGSIVTKCDKGNYTKLPNGTYIAHYYCNINWGVSTTDKKLHLVDDFASKRPIAPISTTYADFTIIPHLAFTHNIGTGYSSGYIATNGASSGYSNRDIIIKNTHTYAEFSIIEIGRWK